MADWSLLPSELLQLISKKLNSEFYLLRFRSVCSTWRSSIPNHRPNNHVPLKLPPLPDHPYSICYLVKHTIFLIKPTTITITNPNQPQQNPQPFLIRIGPNVNGKTRLWHPLNLDNHIPLHFPDEVAVFDFNHISIVDLGHVFVIQDIDSLQNDPFPDVHYNKVVASTYPGEQQPHIVTYDDLQEPYMLWPGGDGWMRVPNVWADCSLGDICNFKGRICVAENTGDTVMLGPGPDFRVDLVADNTADTVILCWVRFCFVESELLLVDTATCDNDAWIAVYRLDEKKKEWVKLSDLGDRVLFLGKQCSFSASAFDLGFANGNCVINMDVSDIGCGLCDLNLDDNQILPLSDYPNYFNLLVASGLDHEELRHWEKRSDEDEDSEDEDEDSENEVEESEEEEDEESEDEDEDEDEEK